MLLQRDNSSMEVLADLTKLHQRFSIGIRTDGLAGRSMSAILNSSIVPYSMIVITISDGAL